MPPSQTYVNRRLGSSRPPAPPARHPDCPFRPSLVFSAIALTRTVPTYTLRSGRLVGKIAAGFLGSCSCDGSAAFLRRVHQYPRPENQLALSYQRPGRESPIHIDRQRKATYTQFPRAMGSWYRGGSAGDDFHKRERYDGDSARVFRAKSRVCDGDGVYAPTGRGNQ